MSALRILHILVFMAALLVWTWALLDRNPVPETVRRGLDLNMQFVFSKILHGSAYAFLTVLGGLIPRARPGRRWIVAFMALHGVGSELAQDLMDVGRYGCVRDVLIDWAGVAAGALVLKRFP